jgi:copper resistance protein B
MNKIMNKLIAGLILSINSPFILASSADDPLISKVMINKFELGLSNSSKPSVLEAEAWIGKDLSKFWVKVDLESANGKVEESEIQLLYSKALYPFWDLQLGLRQDISPSPEQSYFAIGMKGLAPYMVEIDSALYFSDTGQIGIRLNTEIERLITQKLIVSRELGINIYTQDEPSIERGSGLSDLEVGVRMRYEYKREIAPYIGFNWTKKIGKTADYSKASGNTTSDSNVVLGVKAWF